MEKFPMKTLKNVIALVALAANIYFGPEVLVRLLTGTSITGTNPFPDLVTTLQVSGLLIVILLVAIVSFRRDERKPVEILMSGLRLTTKVYWLYIRLVIAVILIGFVATLIAGAVWGVFDPKDVAIFLGLPLLTGFASGLAFQLVKALAARRNNHQQP
jgi:hypothetical protein